jgi:hypothetical protein
MLCQKVLCGSGVCLVVLAVLLGRYSTQAACALLSTQCVMGARSASCGLLGKAACSRSSHSCTCWDGEHTMVTWCALACSVVSCHSVFGPLSLWFPATALLRPIGVGWGCATCCTVVCALLGATTKALDPSVPRVVASWFLAQCPQRLCYMSFKVCHRQVGKQVGLYYCMLPAYVTWCGRTCACHTTPSRPLE